MLCPVAKGSTSFANQPHQIARGGTRYDNVGLLRLATLEYARALEHEGAVFLSEFAGESFESHERCRAVGAIHHEILERALSLEISRVRLADAGARHLR